jgi:WD40 repeat protein
MCLDVNCCGKLLLWSVMLYTLPQNATYSFMIRTFCFLLLLSTVAPVFSQTDISEALSLAWNPDGERLAIGYDDGTVEIRNLETNTSATMGQTTVPILSLAWNPINDDQLAILTNTGVLRIYDVQTAESLVREEIDADSPTFVSWSSDGTKLATADNDIPGQYQPPGAVTILDSQTGQIIDRFRDHEGIVTQVIWNPVDSNLLASTSLDSYTFIWDVSTGKVLQRFFNRFGGISAAWSPDGTELATLSGDGSIDVWDAVNGDYLYLAYDGGFVVDFSWSPDGNFFAIIDGEAIQIVAAGGGAIIHSEQTSAVMSDVVWNPDSSMVAYGGPAGVVDFIQPAAFPIATLTNTPSATPISTPTSTPHAKQNGRQ